MRIQSMFKDDINRKINGVVKVDQDGNVTAVGKGNTKIVVACGGVTAECKVYITG